MSTPTVHLPSQGRIAGFRRFTVGEYHRLIELGILTEDNNVELLEGYLVHKMSRNPPHDAAIQKALKHWLRVLPAGWDLRVQSAVTLTDSEPEPDFAVVRGDATTYLTRHPAPSDIGLVIEVSDSTLVGDRDDKGRIYARANLSSYWIINLIERQVEVYSSPSGPAADPQYAQRVDYFPGANIAFLIAGVALHMSVDDLLP